MTNGSVLMEKVSDEELRNLERECKKHLPPWFMDRIASGIHVEGNIVIEDDGKEIVVYGDAGHDCATFSDDGLHIFLIWCKFHRKKLCKEVF